MIKHLTEEDWLKIANEYGAKKGAKELAQELGVTKQRIQQVAAFMRRNGVSVPVIRESRKGHLSFVKKHYGGGNKEKA